MWEGGRESGDNGRAPQDILHVQENKAPVPRGNSIHSLPQDREELKGEAGEAVLLARLGEVGGLTAAFPLPSQCPL